MFILLFVSFPPQYWQHIQKESDLLWAAIQYFVMYVVIRPTHCIVFKAHVENKGLFYCEVSTVPCAHKY